MSKGEVSISIKVDGKEYKEILPLSDMFEETLTSTTPLEISGGEYILPFDDDKSIMFETSGENVHSWYVYERNSGDEIVNNAEMSEVTVDDTKDGDLLFLGEPYNVFIKIKDKYMYYLNDNIPENLSYSVLNELLRVSTLYRVKVKRLDNGN